MYDVHIHVPGQADKKGQKNTLRDFHLFQQRPTASTCDIKQHDQCREGVSYGALGQQSQTASEVSEVVLFTVEGKQLNVRVKTRVMSVTAALAM